MRRILAWAGLIVLVFVGACRPGGLGSATGADSSQQAIVEFLAATRAQDLQAMSTVWGDAEAPARDRMDRQELERRLIIITCHLRHDQSRLGAAAPGEGGRLVTQVELTKGEKTITVPFTTVRNGSDRRWYVENIDLEPAREFCSTGGAPTPSRRTP